MPSLPSPSPDHLLVSHASIMARPSSEPLPTISPPFDYILRLLSTPPLYPAFDPLPAAFHHAHQHRLLHQLPSLLQQLSRPLLLLHPRPVESRCHLFLLPLYVQRCILSFLSITCVPRPATHSPLLDLLALHSSQCQQHLLEVTSAGNGQQAAVIAEELALLRSEYGLVSHLHHRLYRQLGQPISPLNRSSGAGDGIDRLLAQLTAHSTWQKFAELGSAAPTTDEEMVEGDAESPSTAPPPPLHRLSALSELMRKLCERDGMQWDDSLHLPAPRSPSPSAAAEDTSWTSAWSYAHAPVTESAATSLIDFDDGVFALPLVEETAAQQEGDDHTAAMDAAAMEEDLILDTGAEQPPSSAHSTKATAATTPPSSPPPTVQELQLPTALAQTEEHSAAQAAAAVSTMQSLLSAVMALQFHLADLQGPLSGQLTDEQLRSHSSLLPLIPHVDALHALPTVAFAAAFASPLDDATLTPAALPTKLLYLLIRLLLTASVHHERACLIVGQCLGHVVRGEAHRDVLLAVSHGLSTHPAAVFSALLYPLVTPQGVVELTSAHLDLVRHCVKQTSARGDLTQALLGQVCQALTVNAAPSLAMTRSPLPTSWAMEVLNLLVEAVPGTGDVGGQVVGVVVMGGKGGGYAGLDAGMQSKYGRLMKTVVGKWPEECRRRKGELVAVLQAMSHFSVKRSVERLTSM